MKQLMMLHRMDEIRPADIADGWHIRTFRPGEEEIWLEICRHGLVAPDCTDAWDWAIIARENLVPERDLFFACREDDIPMATTIGYVRPNGIGDIHMVACHTDARGNRLGESLLGHAMAKLKAEMPGENRITRLTTDDWRLPAIKGYIRAGFLPVLHDDDMQGRWTKVLAELGFSGIEMVTEDGESTGVIL
ncbi:MAG: GNAT family N-acetyltransferase [Clostridia bacterium]|nr:GNAT family N-acetyltransferase [Clostridia bacterium]